MTFQQAVQAIERRGYRVLAQTLHPGGEVSYDALPKRGYKRGDLRCGPAYLDPTKAMCGLEFVTR